MTTGTAHRQTQPGGPHQRGSVDNLLDPILFEIGPPFTITQRLPQKTGPQHRIVIADRFPLVPAADQVTRQLEQREFIKRQILIQ